MDDQISSDTSPAEQHADIRTQRIDCPLCSSAQFTEIVQAQDPQWGISGLFQVVRCSSCGHDYMNPAPVLDSLAACYPANYGPHQNLPSGSFPEDDVENDRSIDGAVSSQEQGQLSEKQADGSAQRPWFLRIIPLKKVPGLRRFYFWLMDDRSQVFPSIEEGQGRATDSEGAGLKAFELGCAAGAYLQKLHQAGWCVEGLEPGIEAAKKAQQAGLNVRQGLLSEQTYSVDDYDWIAMWMVLEHVPDPVQTLQQLHRMLRPGGTIGLSVPNAGCWEPMVFGRHWDAWDLPRHLQHFRPKTIRNLLETCGFTDIRIQHQRSVLNVIGSLGVWWTSVFPQSRLGEWLRRYPHRPRLWLQLLCAPVAIGLAFIRQGGRLTITATKSQSVSAVESSDGVLKSDPADQGADQ